MKKLINFIHLGVLAGFMAIVAVAQTPTGSIEGVIKDPSSAVVSGATITITGGATAQSVTTTTNDEGFFSVRSLLPGIYSIKVEQQGFTSATANNIVVQVNQVARVDIGLKVGEKSVTVQVDIGATDIQ